MANVKKYSNKNDGKDNIQPNFKIKEFRCKDGTDTILIDTEMTFILQKIRDILKMSININSAYRTSTYNKKVGGATNSYHVKGQAFDIIDSGNHITSICNIAFTLGVKGIIRYSSFVHIDSRATKYHANSNGSYINYSKYKIPYNSVVKKGIQGIDVGIVQFKLNSLGFNCGIVDGNFGNNTYNAVKKFQKSVGFTGNEIDGIVGINTWNKLFN